MTELTVLMPCLNEAETLETCVRKAAGFLAEHGIDGEVLVADNGSTTARRRSPGTRVRVWWTSPCGATARRSSVASPTRAAST